MIRVIVALIALVLALPVAAQGNYQIKPGDQLRVEVLEDQSLNRTVLVLPDGRINFPLAGSVQASGRTLSQVERALSTQLAPDFAAPPTIYVGIAALEQSTSVGPSSITVYLVGEVNDPGPKEVARGTTFLQMLSQSEGLTRFAATKRLQIRRRVQGQETMIKVDYRAISRGAAISNDPVLADGDVILVPERRLFE